MKKYISIVGLALLCSCAGFEEIRLFNGERTVKLGEPALTYADGDLTKGEWKGDRTGMTVTPKEEGFSVSRTDASNRRTVFYQDFKDAVDFRGNIAVVIVARALDGRSPNLKLALIDNKGKIANGKDLSKPIAVGQDFKTYIFKLDGAFTQISPEVADVNSALIKRIEFAVDQGKKDYSGSIEILEVKIKLATETAPQKTRGPKGKKGGLIVDFDKANIKDWTAKGGGLSISKKEGALVMECKSVGPLYQSVSAKVDLLDLTDHMTIKVRAKVESESDDIPYLRLDFEDINGKVTNKFPVWLQLDEVDVRADNAGQNSEVIQDENGNDITLNEVSISSGERFVDYYFTFSEIRFQQSYPKPVDLDETRIEEIKLYVNPGFMEFTGKVSIQSIEAIK